MPETPIWTQKRAEELYGGAGKHCYVKSAMPGGYEKNYASGTYVRAVNADNQSAPHRRLNSITTLMCHTSAPPPLAELFFAVPGRLRLAEPR